MEIPEYNFSINNFSKRFYLLFYFILVNDREKLIIDVSWKLKKIIICISILITHIHTHIYIYILNLKLLTGLPF